MIGYNRGEPIKFTNMNKTEVTPYCWLPLCHGVTISEIDNKLRILDRSS